MALARVLVLVMLVSLVGVPSPAPPDRLAGLPSVLLWAWERPEDLRFAPRLGVGVAVLDRTITVRGSRIETALRRQRALLDPATPVVAVVRVEADREAARAADPARVAEAIAAAARRPGDPRPADRLRRDGVAARVLRRHPGRASVAGCRAICRCR